MKVFITHPAKVSLRTIITYYKSEGYESYAERLRLSIIAKAKSLSSYHSRGQEEELLRPLGHGHRYLIVEHYKIIYLVRENKVFVTDVFDTRQQPEKLLSRHQK